MSKAIVEDIYPLTPVQQGMLVHALLAPEDDVYLRQISYEIAAPVDAVALERVWQEVADRHPALRTCFAWERRDEPQQIVFRRVRVPFERRDLTGLPAAEQRRQVEALLAAERARPFQLSRAPLLRLVLAALAPDRHLCVWTYHHLLLDGWSVALVLGEVAELYGAAGRAPLPPPPRFADYVAWLRRQDGAAAEVFWRRELGSFTAPTPLGIGRAAASEGNAGAFELDARLPTAAAASLRAFAAQAGLTASTLVYGAWGLLLSRYGGTEDVLFGAVFSGRPDALPESLAMVGLMINTLPLRLAVSPAERAADWLGGVQTRRLALHRFEHSPLVEVQGWSGVAGGTPLFESLVVFENFPRGTVLRGGGPGSLVENVRTLEATSYPLTLLAEVGDEVFLRAACHAGRFEVPEAARLLRHLETLLGAFVATPEAPLDALPLLAPAERHQLLVEWNDTASPVPPQTVPELVARQAALRPEAPAVVAPDGSAISYAGLVHRAGALASHLAGLGVGRGSVVGIYADLNPETVVGLLAVLMAGAAYLPLDPAYPRERLDFMAADAGVAVALTQAHLAGSLPGDGTRAVPLDTPVAEAAGGPAPPVPADLAYVLYTSGSTGRPKGVEVIHASLVNFLESMRLRPGFAAGWRLLAVTSLSFDIAGLEIFLPLIAGGELHLISRDAVRDGDRLAATLAERRIDVLQATPSTWQLLLEAGWRGTSRLAALCGGEALASDLGHRIAGRANAAWNLYGPTETTIWSAVRRVEAPDEGWVPLGRPIANTRILCLGPGLQLLPVGVAGELLIGGAGLARGYHDRPDLTAERFVPDPWSAEPGGRLYRTGDLARRLPDGDIEFLGRLDHQVKVRGHRIELQEVEAALARLPGVAAAVAAAREETPGDRRLVAYLVTAPGSRLADPAELRSRLRKEIPEAMLPSAFVELPALPLTPNGKVDRRALPAPGAAPVSKAAPEPRTSVERTIAAVWREVLGLDRVGVEDNFFDAGGHSLLLLRVRNRLREALGRTVELADLFRHPTVVSLARFLAPPVEEAREEGEKPPEPRPARRRREETAIAIIGMSGRFPGARGLDELWANLRAGVEGIRFFTAAELAAAGVPAEVLSDPSYVPAKGFLDGAEAFDAPLFGVLPRDAELIDPQHRVFLECAWEALEDAGCDPASFSGPIGVYAGASLNSYGHFLPPLSPVATYQAILGNDKDYLATRVSYKLGLRGPGVTVQTACSTSLVAVHLAAQSLLAGECDLALAGGVSVTYPRVAGYFHSEGMITSPDGHCRAFDARARGTVFGEGAGVVVLRRLADALAEGDAVRAVIRGSAVNNDGSAKVSYTSPGVAGQAAVIAEALAVAGVPPESVSYVEAHGTGTPLGDPVEVAALTEVFGRSGRRGFCALGSVKTNLGHLDAAAGVTGLIKTVLALQHGVLPPSLHFERPNPEIDFAAGPFFVSAEPRDWRSEGGQRRAGVSSFGIGGTNAHVVLEEAPPLPPRDAADSGHHLLVLSARTATALEALTDRLAAHLATHPELDLADAAFTLRTGRRPLEHRRTLVCRDREEAAEALAERSPGQVETGFWQGGERPVVALFPGQGAQRAGMGHELYRGEPVFRDGIDRCAEILRSHLDLDLRELLFPASAEAAAGERLRRTALAQPALFAVEHALALLLRSWGVRPRAMLGHSLGELVVACLAGVFTLENALALVATRGRLMEALPEGAMLDVALPEEEVLPLLERFGVALGAVNAPARSVVSGPEGAVAAVEAYLRERGVAARRLQTSHAFHSELMEPALEPFRAAVESAKPQPPRVPFLSNLTGTWIRPEEAADPGYWARHLRQPVRFAQGIAALLAAEPDAVLLELGPGETLTAFARQQPAAAGRAAFSALPGGRGAAAPPFAETLGRLWRAGVPLASKRTGRRVPLPTYPFERQIYTLAQTPRALPAPGLVEAPTPAAVASPAAAPQPPAAGRREQILEAVHGIIRRLSGLGEEAIDPRASFLELGVDSLLLIQFSQAVAAELGVQVPLTRLLEELTTLEALVNHLERELGEIPAPVAAAPVPPPAPAAEPVFIPFQPIDPGLSEELSPRQQRALAVLVERLTARTRESKRRTDLQRPVLADNRASVDFRLLWKEMVYPIIGERSLGSRLWDVDGNEYVDLAMGFGVHLFGHSPAFITEAVAEQLGKGFHLGPQSDLAGEVAEGIAALTGLERVTFSNTGTEAVMTALRLARAVTGRSRVALFAGSYHGSFDGVLARGRGQTDPAPLPVAPGVLPHQVEDLLVLPYGEEAALDALRAEGDRLAAVLVEPVQSRRPDLQPHEFLQELRRLTARSGTALIFDEVITGFRVHPGGAQAWFGVEADLATYGKVLGGGMPVGVVAGRAAYIDAIDGGVWRFGDRSYPRVGKTFFAGTFCKHPLSMAAARAVVRRLRADGPALQEDLNRRTAGLAGRLDEFFARERMPIRMARFGSLFRFAMPPAVRYGALFFYHLLARGVFNWEGRTFFLSTAHDDADLERVVAAVRESALAMREGGFLPEPGEPAERRPAPAVAVPASVPEPVLLPASAGQRQLWLLSQLGEHASRAYNLSKRLRLEGDLDAAGLAGALALVVARHDALRTTFSPDGEFRLVHPALRVALPLADLSGLPPAARDAACREILAGEGRTVFDLARGPLIRALLVRLAERLHVLALTCHHAVVDGRSLGVLLADLEACYTAGAAAPPPPPAAMAHATGEEAESSAALAYWLGELAAPPPALELPADRPRPPVPSFRGGHRALLAGEETHSALRRLARSCGATPFMSLLAVHCALLHRLSGQEDLVVGVPAALSAAAEGAALGYDLALLPLRSRAPLGTPFAGCVAAMRSKVAEGQSWRGFSLSALLHGLGLRPGVGRSPLLSVLFNLDREQPEPRFAGLALELATNPTGGSQFELSVNVTDDGRRLLFEGEHDLDLFDGVTVQRWLAAAVTLLAAAAADPGRPLWELPLLAAAERQQLLREWNDTAAAFGPEACLHELIARQALRTPGAPALIYEGESLTYFELDRRANRLAGRLRELGVGPEARVAVAVERSLELPLALLAVLKAGGAYVPLDPSYPRERLAYMLADSRAAVLVAQERALASLGEVAVPVLLLDEDWGESAEGPRTGVVPENLAYVIYTSGSTGRPKGVMNSHRGIVNRLLWMQAAYGLDASDRVLQKTPTSFDVSVWELFWPLLTGAALVMARPGGHQDAVYLAELIGRQAITTLHFVPSMLQVFVEEAGAGTCSSLRRVICSGEALPYELERRFFDRFEAELHNLYGPTEAAVDVTSWACERAGGARTVPIGRPIANLAIHIADRGLQPSPPGVPGELLIGGTGLGRGYLRRPDLTAERFIPDPFSGRAGERLYRTGDLARHLTDGRIEFLGRLDHQVKIRGFRVELGEIEAAAAALPGVREAVVTVRGEAPGELRLVGYLVPHPGAEAPRPADLAAALARTLPDHMVPRLWVTLDRLPLSPSGKVDRRALPAPASAAKVAGEGSARQTLTLAEELLAGIWAEVLALPGAGPDDDFFTLGGHSLLAARVISRVRQAFGAELPMRALFESPTLRGMAAAVERTRRAGGVPEAPPLARVPRDRPLPLSYAQQRLWFLDQLDPGSAAYNIPAVFHLAGPLSVAALAAALGEILRRHEVLRTTIALRNDEPMQVIAPPAPVPLPVFDLAGLPEAARHAEARRLAREEAGRPFDLGRGPVFRAALVRLAEAEHLVLTTMHHAASDGWSNGILMREMGALYGACRDGCPSPLPELPLQYADYAAWQREWLRGEILAAHLAAWRERLGGTAPVLALPADRPRPAVRSGRGASERVLLSHALTRDLALLGRRAGGTLFMVLLAGLQALLSRLSGQPEVRVGTSAAGRGRVELEGLIGFFVNTLVLRADLGDDPDAHTLLARAREEALSAHAHEDLPFEKLVHELKPEVETSATPLFQVMLALQNVGAAELDLPGLRVEQIFSHSGTAKFDLALELDETPEGLSGTLEYATDLFDRTTVLRLLGGLEQLLAGLAADPARRISRLPLLSPAERHQLLAEWNDTAAPYDRGRLIHQLFREQAARTPGAPAAFFGGESLTYAELGRRVARLAHHLRSLGLGRGDLAGVFLPRSFEMVVAVLAVLEAGGAYVPLATSFPPARRRWILERLGVRILLTHTARLPEIGDLAWELAELEHLVCVDHGEPAAAPRLRGWQRLWTGADLEGRPEHAPEPVAGPGDLAYVIFTSGSTGNPKGVQVRHRPVINLIEWLNRELAAGPADRLLFVTSLTFDLSVWDIFGMLAAGGSLHIAAEADLDDPERLVGLLCGEPITLWDSAPAALQQLVPFFTPAAMDGPVPTLRRVLLSGDWIPVTLPDAVRTAFPKARVLAMGGATEATVWSNFHRVERVDPQWASIPYGRPIPNARYHVLDGDLAPCPIGVAGNLWIGGECLAAGYAAEPALSAERFIPDPWSPLPGGRLYRTGDRARVWRNGVLEFLGRLDHQVKIRGYRIELGEIEATLLQHPEVRGAVVLVREDRPGQRRLAAYVVPRDPAAAPRDLAAWLAQRLPEYMVPAAFVTLTALPVTANGKLDRAALPAPEAVAGERTEGYDPPRTPAEKALAGIWTELLRRERIGIHERFLELGGDSIVSIQIVARAARAGLRILPRQVYELQTIAKLAAAATPVGEVEGADTASGAMPLPPPAAWLLEGEPAEPHHFNLSLMLASRLPLDPARLEATFGHLLAHHDALRLRLAPDRGSLVIPAPGGPSPFLWVDLSALSPEGFARGVEETAALLQASLDLFQGPLARMALLRGGEDRLLLVLHHLTVDGVSWRVLLEDLETVYGALGRGEAVALPQKTASYKRWGERLAERAASPELLAEEAWWLAAEPAVALPLDFPAGRNTVASLATVETGLPAAETRVLLEALPVAYRAGVEEALLAALASALAPWTGGGALRVDLEGHGRDALPGEDLDLSRTVGWFTTLYPVVLPAPPDAGPGEALRAVKERIRAVPGRGLGYGLLRYGGRPEAAAALRAQPPAAILFNYFGQLDTVLGGGSELGVAPEDPGPERGPRQLRRHLFEINASVVGGRLRIAWAYSANLHRRETVAALADGLAEALRQLARHCREPEAGGFTASDFPLAGLDAAAAGRLAARLSAAGVPPREVEDAYTLSPLQEGLLVHALSSPGSQAGVEQLCVTLDGDLDLEAFERTWKRILARHAILRTLFVEEAGGRPLQVALRSAPLPLALEDWRDLPEQAREERLAGFLRADRERGFRLDRAPLLRLSVLRFGDRSWRLVWTHHHLILDGWCRALVLDEFFRTYSALRMEEEPAFPAPPPFRDYVAWLALQDPAEAEGFWRRTLEGFAGPPPLPVTRLSEAVAGGAASRKLPPEVTRSLRAAAAGFGVTLSTLTQAAWALLLARYSGGDDVALGAVVSGRPPDLPGVESMVGMFVNNLPVRIQLARGARLGPWLARLQEWQQELRRFEHSPLPDVQRWSGLPAGRRLFESLVVFQSYPSASTGEGGLGLALHSASLETNYPLTLVAEPEEGMLLTLSCQPGSLDAAGAARALGHLQTLLAGMAAAELDTELDQLPLMTTAEIAEVSAVREAFGIPGTVVALGGPEEELPELALLPGARLERGSNEAAEALLATPAQLQELLAAGWEGTSGVVLCRGEEPARGLADRLLERAREVWVLRISPWPAVARVPAEGPVLLGDPLGGTRWEVLDAVGRPLPVGVPGELAVVSPGEAHRRTGERARRLPGGGVEPLGADAPAAPGAVTAGEVEALLRRHPQVLGAAVAGRAGGRVAWISSDPRRPPSAESLRAVLRAVLPERELPGTFVFLTALDRRALPEGGPADARRPHLPPRDALELALARLWEDLFDLEPVGVRDDFFALGGHSLLAIRLMAEVRARFGRDLPLSTLFQQPTVERLAAALREGGGELPWSPLVPIQPGDAATLPLFLFHPAGGGVLGYSELARRLGPERPVWGLQAWGQEPGQQPLPSLSSMAESYVAALRQTHPHGPYLLAGSSFGAYLAYEAACRLREAGEEVALVALLDAGVPEKGEEPDPREYLGVLVRETLPQFAADLPRDRDLDGQLAWVLAALRQTDLAVAGFELADLRRYFDLYWTNIRAALAWTPRPYQGPVVLFRARDNPETPAALADPAFGWGALARGGVEILEVPGNHFNLLEPPHVQVLAATVRGLLDHAAKGDTALVTSTVPETINP